MIRRILPDAGIELVRFWFRYLQFHQQFVPPEECAWPYCDNDWYGHRAGVRLCNKHYLSPGDETADIQTCDRCGTEYEPYLVFIKDDFVSLTDHAAIQRDYDGVCKKCRRELSTPETSP